MKNYQDTETGQVYAFEDEVDPFKPYNRNIPTTLSETVIPKPSESHLWYSGHWVKDTEVPKEYKPPISSVPSYNPAWVAFLRPYTVVLQTEEDKLQASLEQVNLNTYDSKKLSETVTSLPLGEAELHALISYDGAIAIPRNSDCPSQDKAIDNINQIFCAILLGGIHTEVIYQQELCCGTLDKGKDIFVYTPSLHSRLRNQMASIVERLSPLMHPRVLSASVLIDAYMHGTLVIRAIDNFSPFFLLHGYTAMVYQNRSDALASLWIVVEQLTWFLWGKYFSCDHPDINLTSLIATRKSQSKDTRVKLISVKHELLLETKSISKDCFDALSAARGKRNDLAHRGLIPDILVIENLWVGLSELFHKASGLNQSRMQQLLPTETPELGFSENNNFDEWLTVSNKLNNLDCE